MSYFYYQSKKIYYTETGSGKPVLFLHGNTASSRMFELLLPLYEDQLHVILIDFLGQDVYKRQVRMIMNLIFPASRLDTAYSDLHGGMVLQQKRFQK